MAIDPNAPNTTTAAPALPPDIPNGPAPATLGGLDGLVQPGSQAPNLQTAAVGSAQQAFSDSQAAYKKAAADAQPAPPPPPGPHARLLAMVSGLALGLDSFGKAIATHGREGGAEEVQQVEAEQQQQKIQAQQAEQAKRNGQVQNDLMVGQTNERLGNSAMVLATLPNQITKSDLETADMKANVALKQFDLFANTGLSPDAVNSLVTGGTVDSKTSDVLRGKAQQQYGFAAQVLKPNDPYLVGLKTALDDPNAPISTVIQASNRLQAQVKGQADVAAEKTKKEAADANSPVAKLSTPEALAAPGAQAAIQAKIDDPSTDPADLPRLRALLPKAFVAQANADAIKQRQAAADQAVKTGTPESAGTLLANYGTTISELKSRGMTPDYVQRAIASAQKLNPQYNAIAADNYAKIAGSEQNNQFFGNVNSLVGQGGTLDQLAVAGKNISQSDYQILNKAKNWISLQTGDSGISANGAKLIAVADDYAKVLGGSTGSDTARAMILKATDPNSSPAQRAAIIQAMKDAVNSQKNARIGNNPFLKLQYSNVGEAGTPKDQTSVADPSAVPGLVIH